MGPNLQLVQRPPGVVALFWQLSILANKAVLSSKCAAQFVLLSHGHYSARYVGIVELSTGGTVYSGNLLNVCCEYAVSVN